MQGAQRRAEGKGLTNVRFLRGPAAHEKVPLDVLGGGSSGAVGGCAGWERCLIEWETLIPQD